MLPLWACIEGVFKHKTNGLIGIHSCSNELNISIGNHLIRLELASNWRWRWPDARDLLLALDGKLTGKTHRLTSIDLYGACLVLWSSVGGSQSYL